MLVGKDASAQRSLFNVRAGVCSDSRYRDLDRRLQTLRSWATRGESVVRRRESREVPRPFLGPHLCASVCLSPPDRRLGPDRPLHLDSRPYRRGSTLYGQSSALHEQVNRNRGWRGDPLRHPCEGQVSDVRSDG